MSRFHVTFAALVSALTLTPLVAAAQDRTLAFSVTGGASVRPSYFGADDFRVGPTGALGFTGAQIGAVMLGNPELAPTVYAPGAGLRGSFRVISKREGKDELEGLDDVDLAVEAGLGAHYTAETWQVFTDLRYGVIGHKAIAGEVGANLIYRGAGGLVIHGGPRAEFGNSRFMRTYFGVTDPGPESGRAPALRSAYTPSGGIYTYGLEVGAYQPLSSDWGVSGTLRYDRLHGDAADSPIVQQGQRDQISAQIGLTRHFNLRF